MEFVRSCLAKKRYKFEDKLIKSHLQFCLHGSTSNICHHILTQGILKLT